MVLSFTVSGVRFGYKLEFEGKTIATLKNKSQFVDAVSIVKEKVNSDSKLVEEAVISPSYKVAVVLNDNIDDDVVIADAIIENTDDIVETSEISVDGKVVATVPADEIKDYIDDYCAKFTVESDACSTEFVGDVEIVDTYHLAEELDDIEVAKQTIDALEVKTVAQVTSCTEIPYKTVTVKSNELVIGDSKVQVAGAAGAHETRQVLTYINGEIVDTQILSDTVITEPVDRVVVVGTARSSATAAQKSVAHNSGFIFPLPNGTWQVSAYYGDGRGHKGMDLRAPKGTSIFAVKSGTVVAAGSKGGYGYYVDIDHGNGLVTRYAHASVLCVSRGDRVNAGDVIARVGSTGNSTGNHLHFEVISGGSNRDPAPYIGLD